MQNASQSRHANSSPYPQTAQALYGKSIVGFACNQAFMLSLIYLGQNYAVELNGFFFERIDLFVTLACMLVGFGFIRSASDKARRALFSFSLMTCFAILMTVGSFVRFVDPANPVVIIVESVLVGVSAGCMLACWGGALGTLQLNEAIRAIFAALCVAAVISLAVAIVPIDGAQLLIYFMPLISVIMLRPFCARMRQGAEQGAVTDVAAEQQGEDEVYHKLTIGDIFATKEQRSEVHRLSRKVLVGTVLFGVAAGFMQTFDSMPQEFATPYFASSLILLILFTIAALQLVPRAGEQTSNQAQQVSALYRVALLVMMAGFLFLPVLGSFGVPGEAIVQAGYLGLVSVMLSLFMMISNITNRHPAVMFSRGLFALYLGVMIGILIGNVIEFVTISGELPYVLAACSGLSALYAYMFLFTEQDFISLTTIVDDVRRFDEVCSAIATKAGLSKREAELLPLALKGRTGERIAQELYISKSTVETHLRRIYQKTGVKNRQELIDLSERFEQGEGELRIS